MAKRAAADPAVGAGRPAAGSSANPQGAPKAGGVRSGTTVRASATATSCSSRGANGDFFLLIDCGVHSSVAGGSETIAAIVADIAEVTKGKIDVLVVTHEHWDHVSGFLTAAEAFGAFEVGEVWLAWTENPRDRQARELDKYKADAIAALQLAHQRLSGVADRQQLGAIGEGLGQVLGFVFGAKGEKVRDAETRR